MSENTTSYTVLARRFRPQTFDEVVGQQPVAQALKNAIANGRVAHAYLFTGARGVGKTSMARILAKALNCPNVEGGIPCNSCDICDGIAAGSDVDVLEIDGASNRGIDDIRSLRASVNVKSMRTQFKMYIIDEVHMLTKEAFNALLKTLEEPPPNVKFVFCTTEPNKVPDTILSRCQRFDFSTIATQNIAIRLQQIAEAEGFTVEDDAVQLIARRACGSMRDSQSLFDQLLAFSDQHIAASDVHRLFGTADDERLISLFDALLNHQQGTALMQLDEAIASGVQLSEFVDQLLSYLRDLMVLASGANDVGLLSVSSSQQPQLEAHAQQWGLQTTVTALQILSDAKTRMARTTMGRVLVELALVRLCLLEELNTLTELVANWKSGTAPSAVPAAMPAPAQRAITQPAPVRPETVQQTQARPDNAPAPTMVASESRLSDNSVSQELLSEERASTEPENLKKNQNDLDEQSPVPAQSTLVEESAAPTVSFEVGNEQQLWAQVVSQIDDALKTHIATVSSVAISAPNQLQLTFPAGSEFNKKYCEKPNVLGEIERIVNRVAGKPVRIGFVVTESKRPETTEDSQTEQASSGSSQTAADAPEDPFVETVKTLFGSSVIKFDRLSRNQS